MKKIFFTIILLFLLLPFMAGASMWGPGAQSHWSKAESLPSFPATEPDFSIIVLGDIQKIAHYPTTFNAETTYIASKKTEWNIKLVLQVGDVIDGSADRITEFTSAQTGLAIIRDAGIPILVTYGAHDLISYDARDGYRGLDFIHYEGWLDFVGFNDYFGDTFYAGQSWFNGELKKASYYGNYYIKQDIGSYKFLIFSLEYYTGDAAIAWAQAIINANQDRFVIINTHALTGHYSGTERYSLGADLWSSDPAPFTDKNAPNVVATKLINLIPNMMLAVCGHLQNDATDGVGYLTYTGALGQKIHIARTCFQNQTTDTGKYFVRLNFSPANHTITMTTSSAPSGDAYASFSTTALDLLPVLLPASSMWGVNKWGQ